MRDFFCKGLLDVSRYCGPEVLRELGGEVGLLVKIINDPDRLRRIQSQWIKKTSFCLMVTKEATELTWDVKLKSDVYLMQEWNEVLELIF